MQVGAITGYMDVAQITLYAFWIFFFCLIVYLRGEDRKEGYPLVEGNAYAGPEDLGPMRAIPTAGFPGAPLTPTGNPLLAGVGPGAWAERADVPEASYEDRSPKIVPLRVAEGFYIEPIESDPRGFTVIGADRQPAGTVSDVWVDRHELLIRYFEVEVAGGAKHVLVPGPLARVQERNRTLKVESILGSQFADVPTTKSPDQVTLLEEDQISAYYGAGKMYATPSRAEPLL
jgi:photosynthetic reaction center H subunit